MKTQFGTILAAVGGIGGATLASLSSVAHANELPMAETSVPCVYSADTLGSPHNIKTADDQSALWAATRRTGETVTVVSPSGARTTLIAAESDATSAALNLNAGGVWTLENSEQGTATFTVRHSLYGTQGAGTEASPAKLVDGDELVDLSAGDGFVFSLEPVEGLLNALSIPLGFRLVKVDDTTWRIVTSADGCLYAAAEIVYPIDSVEAGPNRSSKKKEVLPVSYSGDDWVRDMSKASPLTFVAPDGVESTVSLNGTGAAQFKFHTSGVWTVRLTMADGSMKTAILNIISDGFTVTLR
jgi:hypothetical protein